MNDTLQESIAKALDGLSARLGVATDKMWPVLVLERRATAVSILLRAAVATLVLASLEALLFRYWRADIANEGGRVAFMVIGIVIKVIVACVFWNDEIVRAESGLRLLMSPEGAALDRILSMIGGK